MQNKPYFFFWKQGGGSDTWEKFPKNPVFFFGSVPKYSDSGEYGESRYSCKYGDYGDSGRFDILVNMA